MHTIKTTCDACGKELPQIGNGFLAVTLVFAPGNKGSQENPYNCSLHKGPLDFCGAACVAAYFISHPTKE